MVIGGDTSIGNPVLGLVLFDGSPDMTQNEHKRERCGSRYA